MTIKAINKKHQTRVNKACQWLAKHNEFDRQRNEADGLGDNLGWTKANRNCERTFDKFLEYIEELPKREADRIYNSDLY